MKVYLSVAHDLILVQVPFTNPAGDLGGIDEEIRPGETWEGHTFQQLHDLGDGEHELTPRD